MSASTLTVNTLGFHSPEGAPSILNPIDVFGALGSGTGYRYVRTAPATWVWERNADASVTAFRVTAILAANGTVPAEAIYIDGQGDTHYVINIVGLRYERLIDGLYQEIATLTVPDILIDIEGTVGRIGDDILNRLNEADFVFNGSDAVDIYMPKDPLLNLNIVGPATYFMGGGNDVLETSNEGADLAYGGDGDDTLETAGGDDLLDGGDGNDRFETGGGNDTVRGGAGNDTISVFSIEGGKKLIEGGAGADQVGGGSGGGIVWGHSRAAEGLAQSMSGDAGDEMNGGDGVSAVYGQQGNDTVRGNDGNDRVYGGEQADQVFGQADDDLLYGDNVVGLAFEAGNDTLYGGSGRDQLSGGVGIDDLRGDSGNDVLIGGAGNDSLNGDENSDSYIWRRGDGWDSIRDNSYSADNLVSIDVLRLEGIEARDVRLVVSPNVSSTMRVQVDGAPVVSVDLQFSTSSFYVGAGIEQIRFDDGTVIARADFQSIIQNNGGYLTATSAPVDIDSYGFQLVGATFAGLSAATHDMLIVQDENTTLTPGEVATLVAQGKTMVAYVNAGVTDDLQPYWDPLWGNDAPGGLTALAPAWLQGQPRNTFGILPDITAPEWQTIVIERAVALVRDEGYTGVYLDDVGRYYDAWVFANTPPGSANIAPFANAMIDLVVQVKDAVRAINPNAVVVVNGDPYIVTNTTSSEHRQAFLNSIDAMLLDNLFGVAGSGTYTAGTVPSAIAHAIQQIQPYAKLFAIEHSGTGDEFAAFIDTAWANGIVPYTSPTPAYDTLTPAAVLQAASAGADLIGGDAAANVIDGLGGNDTINGQAGGDHLTGGSGNDSLTGGDGNDSLSGGLDNDTLVGGVNADTLDGGDGADLLLGGSAQDLLTGGQGLDTQAGGSGNDVIRIAAADVVAGEVIAGSNADGSGGSGSEVDQLEFYGGGVLTLSLATVFDIDRVVYIDGGEIMLAAAQIGSGLVEANATIKGSAALDILTVTMAATGTLNLSGLVMSAWSSSDYTYLQGAVGNDTLVGTTRKDFLRGAAGADTVTGGDASDIFIYTSINHLSATAALSDTITDFTRIVGNLDRINIKALDANTGLAGDQAFSFIGASGFTNVAGQLRFQTSGANAIVEGDNNGDGIADFRITVLGQTGMVAGDFVL